MATPNQPSPAGLTAFLHQRYPLWNGGVLPPVKAACFRIDDRNDKDVYPGFCDLVAAVPDTADGEVLLVLANAPHNPDVLHLLVEKGGRHETDRFGNVKLMVPLRACDRRSVAFLRKFGKAVKKVVGRGQRYLDPQWWWICPRTADALDRFADVMMEFNSSPRGG